MKELQEKIVLVDGNAIIHRAYHALPPLTTKKGELVNAVFGFSSILLKVMSEIKPKYMAVTFDLKAPTFRHVEYKEYKATRVKAPDDLYAQIDRVKEVVKAFNIPIFEIEGFEADDIIGTLSSQMTQEKMKTVIVTGDLDTLQLVNDYTQVYALRKGMSDITIYNVEAVKERFSLNPSQMIEYKGLRGDASDNIPGVKGIGEKTAIELLKKYQSIEGVYKNIEEIKGAVQKKLKEGKEQALMSKRLATIRLDVPIKLSLAKAVLQEFDKDKVIGLFQDLGFFSLIKRIPMDQGEEDQAREKSKTKEIKEILIDKGNIKDWKKTLSEVTHIGLTINQGKSEKESKLVMALGEENIWSVYSNELELVKDILSKSEIVKVGYDLKKICLREEALKEILKNNSFDLMLAAYVLDPGRAITLEKLMEEFLRVVVEKTPKTGQLGLGLESLSQENKNQEKIIEAGRIFALYPILKDKMKEIMKEQSVGKNTVQSVFDKLEMPLVEILVAMEKNGVKVDVNKFESIKQELTGYIQELEKEIYAFAKGEFNINSPKQVAEVLFKKLKLPTENIKKLKTGFSTASAELKKLSVEHPIVVKLEEYREFFKLKTTYLDTLPTLIDRHGRIHTQFNQAVTATGRLSSSEPNLQNIPTKTNWGKKIRSAFVSSPGWKLLSADYSQIDLRVVAHLSQDKKMIEAFEHGQDIHLLTAAEVNKVPLNKVTDKMRSRAKALNFGIIYGISAFGFSSGSGISQKEAQSFIEKYFERFPGVAVYMDNMKKMARQKLFAETELGRRRYLPEINSSNMMLRHSAERMAINMPVQGLTADIMKLAMIKTFEAFKNDESVKMILQIHDEIIWEVKEERVEEVAQKIKTIMENVYRLRVPLIVDTKIGDNWGEI